MAINNLNINTKKLQTVSKKMTKVDSRTTSADQTALKCRYWYEMNLLKSEYFRSIEITPVHVPKIPMHSKGDNKKTFKSKNMQTTPVSKPNLYTESSLRHRRHSRTARGKVEHPKQTKSDFILRSKDKTNVCLGVKSSFRPSAKNPDPPTDQFGNIHSKNWCPVM